ncbi:MAG: TonB-dependent receptor [Sulfuricella sp.]|nr:TonB-dependent receptor [Sulfuricella sp.]
MKVLRKRTLAALIAAICQQTGALAATEQTLPDVIATTQRDALDERKDANAQKIVYDRKELERYNEMTVGDVLRKLPGVVFGGGPGETKDVSLRGLDKGYTQVLINGGRTLGGGAERAMEMDVLPADLIERIEIIRNPTADQSVDGIGGTINIVLREIPARAGGSFRAGINQIEGVARPQLSANYSNGAGDFSYLLNGSAVESSQVQAKHKDNQGFTAGGARSKWELEDENKQTGVRELSFAPRLRWNLGGGDTLLLEPLLLKQEQHTDTRNDKSKYATPATGTGLAGNGFTTTSEDKEKEVYRLQGEWLRHLPLGELQVRLSAQQATESKDQLQQEYSAANALTKTTIAPGSKEDRESALAAKWSAALGGHLLGVGAETSWRDREDSKTTTENGKAKASSLGDKFNISEKRLVLWVQDEWHLNPEHVLTPGLHREEITTQSVDGAGAERDGTIQFLAPSLHYLWQVTPATNFRASVAKSVRPPKFDDLSNVVIAATGANSSTNADKSGNADLRPESAIGYEIGVEHFLPNRAGLVAVNLFQRDIEDMVQKTTTLESNGRWVERPYNAGDGRIWGVEMDFRVAMDTFGAPGLTLLGNHSLLHSSITNANGVTAKVKNQPGYVSNLGFDYDLRSWGITFGANYNVRGELLQEDSATKHQTEATTERLDVFVAKRLDRNFTLRLSASNALDGAKDKETLEYYSPGALKTATREYTKSAPVYYLTLEGKW